MTVASQEPEVATAVEFSLTPEQKAIRDMAREFARKEIDPIVEEIDESQEFPRQLFAKAAELGFLGILFPEKYGGAGLGYVDYVLVINELTKVDPSIGLSVAAHNSLCSNHIFKFGSEEQIERWLVPLARGEKIGAWSLTEPGAGSDAAGTRSRAERVDGGWKLNGSKTFTTHGSVGDICVVFAVTDPDGPRQHSISAFVVEKGTPGFRTGKKENKLGT
ncbi:MAG: acyl-CoA dehydrogenase, partial [Acidobacteria bacterium]